ncbi:general odorant-binding protein 56a-like [Monomorium pharaonis]|uniref:general odorant-binding protein 56a n=1 Tax=Monomorium pharaonis TaxID=307658 RepID=UPI00063FB5A2|nr:general odorant-binding protein 56a [Monomorium pharaonis]XP_036150484.1 general odorant-binding protein 56a-like [Monomorium pharaonis]
MKAIITVLAISFAAVLGQITLEQKEKLRQHRDFCIGETGVHPTVLENVKKGQIVENDEKLNCFADCLLRRTEIITEYGDVDWDVARAKLPRNVSQEQADQIYNACKNITGTGCSKGANLFKCFLRNKQFHLLA